MDDLSATNRKTFYKIDLSRPGRPDMQIILCTINCHTKEQLMVIPIVSSVFLWSKYGKSVNHKLVRPVNDFNGTLYGLSQHICEACGQTIPSAKDTPGP